jgi:hypothetical protein
LQRGAWDEARELFERAVARYEIPEGLEGLSWAAWWQYDGDAMFEAREGAYRHYRAACRARDAARMATWLGTDSVDFRGQLAVAEGWFRRARRLLENVPPCAELGWLCVHEAEKRLFVHDNGVPAYLEATSERNVRLYLRHGFDVTEQVRLPGGPLLTLM